MKRKLFAVIILITASLCWSQNLNSGRQVPSPYEPEVLKAFADSLFEDGFISQAEGEYKRLIFALPQQDSQTRKDNPLFQSSLLSLTNIYKKQQNINGIEWLRNGFYFEADIPVKEKMNFVQAEFLFKEREAQAFNSFTNSLLSERKDFSPDFKDLIDVSELLLNNDIGGLNAFCKALRLRNSDYEKLYELSQSYKLKSPGLALFFSSLIPGSGKWYTGSFPAFVSSFLTIGSFAAGTVITGIQSEWKSWQPYVFGACGLVLYISELYGAYQSAKRYNAALFRNLCEETEKIYEKEY